MTALTIFSSEFLGTALMVLLGMGTVANNLLRKDKGRGGGWLMIALGWGLGVFVGVFVAWRTGGHLNPVVTLTRWVQAFFDPELSLTGLEEFPIAASPGNVALYILAQLTGAFVGGLVVWLAYKKQFDEPDNAAVKLGVFATGPEVPGKLWPAITEGLGAFVLIAFVAVAGGTPTVVGPLSMALVVVVIGIGLGGPTGFAINPARDLGGRAAHAVLPIPGKGSSNWQYSWVPVVGPLVGGVVAILAIHFLGFSAPEFLETLE